MKVHQRCMEKLDSSNCLTGFRSILVAKGGDRLVVVSIVEHMHGEPVQIYRCISLEGCWDAC